MKLIFATAMLAASFTVAPAMAQTAPAQDASAQATGNNGAERLGGYMPSKPALSGPVTPQTRVIFRANPQTPSEAFPPPPPKAEYPICQRGQYDGCRQRGG